MTVVAHHRTRHRDPDEQSRRVLLLKALVTVLLVTAVVASALGAATYVASRAFVGLLG